MVSFHGVYIVWSNILAHYKLAVAWFLAPGVAVNMYIHTSYEAILEHAKSMRASLHAPVDPRRLASELEPLPEHYSQTMCALAAAGWAVQAHE